MAKELSALSIQLFYSYSHRDAQHRESMERTLSLLRQRGLLSQWDDTQILPGQSISKAIEEKIASADIIVYLISPDFIASAECNREWERGQALASKDRIVFRIPIILRPCAWQDYLDDDDVKALPTDGMPVSSYADEDAAWQEVYEGIKSVIETLRATFAPKATFADALQATGLPSQTPITLGDIFVFPRLTESPTSDADDQLTQATVRDADELLRFTHCLIHGPDKAGKTALARHLYLTLVRQERPALLIDCDSLTGRLNDSSLRTAYEIQFHGDYYLWSSQPNKTLVIDNLKDDPRLLTDLANITPHFAKIFIILPSDLFHTFFRDERRLATFRHFKIEPLLLRQQETLIRKRLPLLSEPPALTDGYVDQVEDHVNSVVLSNKILPRYPFFVLSVLQTYEPFMPQGVSITSYSHCYFVFILSSFLQVGFSEKDDDITTALNFSQHLAFARYRHSQRSLSAPFDLKAFIASYRSTFIIPDSIINRLTQPNYGVLTIDGSFKTDYMYYYFLGQFLANHSVEHEDVITDITTNTHLEENYLTTLFTIHHAVDDRIVDDITLRTMCSLNFVPVATLSEEETRRFSNIIDDLPENVLSDRSVAEERAKERDAKDNGSSNSEEVEEELEEPSEQDVAVEAYRVLRNNKILGQVLRTRYGKLTKPKIEDIIEGIVDSSLRMVNLVLKDEDEISRMASYIREIEPEADLGEVQRSLRFLSFLWTMNQVEQEVDAINVPSIAPAIQAVVSKKDTPVYELLGYFSEIDRGQTLTERNKENLRKLTEKYADDFVAKVLSIRTQMYMNTHKSATPIEQAVCSVLGIKYIPRLRAPQ